MIKIVITDDHPIVTEGLHLFLSNQPDITVLSTFSNGNDLMEGLKSHIPDVLLLDIYLQDSNGLDVCKKISEHYPEIAIVALSGQDEGIVISQMLQNGALGYVLKNAESEEITEAIRTVYHGEKFLCTRTKKALQKLDKQLTEIPKITRREKEVLLLIAEGMTTSEIAEKLFISTHTVESHRKNLIEKFDAKSTTSVISIVKNLGLI